MIYNIFIILFNIKSYIFSLNLKTLNRFLIKNKKIMEKIYESLSGLRAGLAW
jgi:hypothetical protein